MTVNDAAEAAMRKAIASGVLAMLLAAAGCGTGSPGEGQGGSAGEDTVELTVGIIPIVEVAPLQIAQDQGYFREQGLEVRTRMMAGGAEVVPAVVSGDLQIGWGNTTSTLAAVDKGLPLKVIAPGAQSGTGSDDISALVVPKASTIRSPQELDGKTVAVPTLNSIADLTVTRTLEKAGLAPSEVEFMEVGFPDMPAALVDGTVDAAFIVEPFRTIVIGQGAHVVARPFTESVTGDRLQTTQWLTTSSYLESNPDVVERFVAAIKAANEYAQGHPEAVRAAVQEYTEIPPEVVAEMNLPTWTTTHDRSSMEQIGSLQRRYGQVDGSPDLEGLLVSP